MMSATTSATTGRRYGLERVCRTWERSRSALYARRARAQCRKRGAGPARRGPTPALSCRRYVIRPDIEPRIYRVVAGCKEKRLTGQIARRLNRGDQRARSRSKHP